MFIGDLIGEVYRERGRESFQDTLLPPHKIFSNPAQNYTTFETGLMVIKQKILFFNIKTYDVM
jgi:hypothetical protein